MNIVRSLFSRLFISFLTTMLLAAMMSALVFFTMRQFSMQEMRETVSREFDQSIARFLYVSGQAAHDTFRASGKEAYLVYLREFEAGTGTRLRVFDETDTDLSGQPVPEELRQIVGLAKVEDEPQFQKKSGRLLVARRCRLQDSSILVIAGIHQLPPPPPERAGMPPDFNGKQPGFPEFSANFSHLPPEKPGHPPEFHPPPPPAANHFFLRGEGVRMAIMIVVAAAVCFFLARSFSIPLTKLRKLTRRIAQGDFSARVGSSLQHAAAELVHLGEDFDQMAMATEKMILSRQRLLQDISHELRSPLARLKVALELARKRFNSPNDSCFLAIDKESDRLNDLIGQLLFLTRIEDSAAFFKQKKVNLKTLVEAIIMDANFEVHEKRRKILATEVEEIMLEGSEELLHRAIENVIRNAAMYTREDTEVKVSVRRDQDLIRIEISDSGPGVPEEELESIFLPFYRVGAARERQNGGSGLGLAIAAQAIQQHGGRVDASNNSTGGLIVRLLLPADRVSDNNTVL